MSSPSNKRSFNSTECYVRAQRLATKWGGWRASPSLLDTGVPCDSTVNACTLPMKLALTMPQRETVIYRTQEKGAPANAPFRASRSPRELEAPTYSHRRESAQSVQSVNER